LNISFANAYSPAKLVAVPVFKKAKGRNVDTLVDDAGAKMLDAANIDGTSGRMTFLPAGERIVLAMGAGKREKFDAEIFSANVIKALRTSGNASVAIKLDGLDLGDHHVARAAVGARLAGYRFDKHRTKIKPSQKITLTELTILCDDPDGATEHYNTHDGPIADGVLLARDLVNEPPNVIYPSNYAKRIEGLDGGLEIEILDEAKMTKLGMNALLGVGVGSERESQLVIMRWNGGEKGDAPALLVGKGVTFDTGGISLKPGANMWDMKGDMGGSAAVVGTMYALAKRNAKANVIGVVGLVENMPDGRAQLPGDIVTSMSGQTIEVQNTDAEGRLVLADALFYAIKRFKPDAVVDLATLTGAIIVTLGSHNAGLFTPSDELAKELEAASKTSGERIWRLPLDPFYDKMLDSPNADMKNIGGREAGSITAAQFLKRFVGDAKWAHLDIAGTGMKNKRSDPRETTFGTGFGVRLLNAWVAENYES